MGRRCLDSKAANDPPPSPLGSRKAGMAAPPATAAAAAAAAAAATAAAAAAAAAAATAAGEDSSVSDEAADVFADGPRILSMTFDDFDLVERLERKVDVQRFATVLKAYLIVKTRIAARRADKEFKKQTSGTFTFTKRTSRVALSDEYEHTEAEKSPVSHRSNRMRRIWSFKRTEEGDGGAGDSEENKNPPPSLAAPATFGAADAADNDDDDARGDGGGEAGGRRAASRERRAYPNSLNLWESEKSLLEQRLAFLGCKTIFAVGDGNCQFRSCSFSLFGDEEYHKIVRQKAVKHMKERREEYGIFFEGQSFDKYIKEMGRSGTWGDELTLRATADCFRCTIHLITSVEHHWYLRYDPEKDGKQVKPKRHLFLTYISPIHYNAFYLKDQNYREK